MRAIRYLGVIGAVTFLVVGLESGGAQPYSRQELLNRGNSYWQNNCVISAMNYYALLQQFPGWPDSDATQKMRARIESCKNGSVGMAGNTGKADDGTSTTVAPPHPVVAPLPPIEAASGQVSTHERACRAYAATALVQVQSVTDGQCNQGGARWSADYDIHYNWCMQAGTPDALQAENSARSNIVNACVFRW